MKHFLGIGKPLFYLDKPLILIAKVIFLLLALFSFFEVLFIIEDGIYVDRSGNSYEITIKTSRYLLGLVYKSSFIYLFIFLFFGVRPKSEKRKLDSEI